MRRVVVFVLTALAFAGFLTVQGHAFSSDGDASVYTFHEHQPGNPHLPVTYSSCKPIRVQINFAGVRDKQAAKQIVLSAMGEASAASGLQLHYVGETTRRPRWPDPTLTIEGGVWPVLVAWADSAELPAMSGAAGLGGSTSIARADLTTYVTGTAALDTSYWNDLVARGDTKNARAIVMHELGHVLGLGHVQNDHEIMSVHDHGSLEYQAGDRLGLARLGKGPCS